MTMLKSTTGRNDTKKQAILARAARGARAVQGRMLEELENRVMMTSIPTGAITAFNTTTISGYAFNTDDGQLPQKIVVTINGTVASDASLVADQNSAAVPAAVGSPFHGFTFTMPQLAPGVKNTVVVTAVSPTTGAKKVLQSGTLINAAPSGKITLNKTGTDLSGYAYDPDAGAPIMLQVDIDGVAGTPFATNLFNATAAKVFHTGSLTLGFDLPGSYVGHVVEVYGTDTPTGSLTLLFSNNHKPVGKVEVNNGVVVSGWALDPDSGANPINVLVKVDGVTLAGTPTAANLNHAGSVNGHGFSVAIPGLTPGKHTVAVYTIDGQSNLQALLKSATVINNPPTGAVTSITSTTITGWALDKDLGASPTTINVYVDDSVFATGIVANGTTGKLTGSQKGHGFTVDISSLGTGSHSITITALDNRVSAQQEVVIYDDFINNHPPIGKLQSATVQTLTGFAYDLDAITMNIPVDIYVDGVYAKTVTADQVNADPSIPAGANHGFVATMPPLSYGTHKIDIYAAESQGNVSVLIGSATVTKANHPQGSFEAASATTVTGWAADPDAVGQAVTVQVYVNGVPVVTDAVTDQARPDVQASAPFNTNVFNLYGFSITLPTLSSGTNVIDVYAVDVNNNSLQWLGEKSVVV
jgi:hypothetical protein